MSTSLAATSLAPAPSLAGGDPGPPLYTRCFAIGFASQLFLVLANTLMSQYARWIEFLGGGVRDVGWVMGGGAVLGLLLRPSMGQWINRLGARKMWAAGLVLFELGVLGNVLIYNLSWTIYALRASMLLGIALIFTSSLTYITQIAPPLRRTEAIGVFGAAGFVGMFLGPYLGDLILGDAADRSRGEFLVLFVAGSTAVALAGLLLFLIPPTPHDSRNRSVRLADFFVTVRQHWPGAILLVNVSFGLCLVVPFGFLPSYIDHAGLQLSGLSPFGLFFVVYGGWGLMVRLATRQLPDRFGRRKVLLAGMSFYTLGMFSFLLTGPEQPWLLLLSALLCGTGHAFSFPTINALALEHFPSEVRGSGSALSLMAFDLGTVGGAPILGALAARFGYGAMFITVGCTGIVTLAYYTYASVPIWRERKRLRLAGRGPQAVELAQPLAAATSVHAHHLEQAELPQPAEGEKC